MPLVCALPSKVDESYADLSSDRSMRYAFKDNMTETLADGLYNYVDSNVMSHPQDASQPCYDCIVVRGLAKRAYVQAFASSILLLGMSAWTHRTAELHACILNSAQAAPCTRCTYDHDEARTHTHTHTHTHIHTHIL